ncbi:MAG: hypothetical protein KJZ93_15695 [Caldilineaceae bacterium]|nr:hypothetical protein [Caldilineaceae bacterium]
MRTNRQLLRLFFLLVILMGLLGGWYADQRWYAATQGVSFTSSGEMDWVNLLADLAENSVKFLQGAASTSE